MLTDQSLKNDWDVLIGHFLGVDHCGHRYGPQHFAMKQKLNQMNKVVQDVIDSLDDDTMLIVFGDHGMDPVGNHGGESVDEIESTIFMYSKTPYFGRLDDSVYDITNAGKNYRKINQIDLVPTMSFLLGMPIPFNSLGSPIDEVFLGLNNNNYEQLAKLDHITSGQIQSFRQKTPSLANNEEINDMFSELSNEWLKTISNNNNNEIEKTDAFKEYILKSRKYQSVSLEECKNLWARFDLLSISIGIIITFVALLLLIIYSKLIPSVVVAQLNPQFLSSTVALLFVYGIIFASFCNVIKPEGLPLTWGLLLATAIAIVNGILAPVMNRFSVPWLIAQVQENLIQNGWTYFALVIILLHSVIFTSNSFIIWEDKIVTFWLSTFGFCAVFKSFQKKDMADKLIGVYHSSIFIILTRLASTIRYCREEQGEKCQSNFNFSFWSVGLLYITAYLLPLIINYFYKITSSYEGAASLWISKTLRSLMFLIAIMWTLEYVEQDSFINENYSIPHDSLKSIRITIARIVIGASLIAGTIGWSMGPLCIRLDVTKPEATETTDSSSGNTNNSAKIP
ncbi:unnamed protein product [[Candida] boidinii]|uniref:Unnamed protein product n=1 Tax=Candida boidinii TaxID=5477 RepID=A0A9W6T7R8_CANBO|nr:unnamed protein product [[Candida] boidinii]